MRRSFILAAALLMATPASGAGSSSSRPQPEEPVLLLASGHGASYWTLVHRSGLKHRLANETSASGRARLERLLGETSEALSEHEEAKLHYQRALGEARAAGLAAERQAASAGLIRLLTLTDPNAAAALLPELQDVANHPVVHMLRARLALATGNLSAASAELRSAIGAAAARSNDTHIISAATADLALVAQLSGAPSDAVKYLAAAGQAAASPVTPQDASFAACGGDLRPSDFVIAEVSTRSGYTTSASIVYTNRPGPHAAALLRPLLEWRWTPAETAANDQWGRGVRVRLSCSQDTGEPWWFDATDTLWPWYAKAGVAAFQIPTDGPALEEALLTELKRRETLFGAASPQVVPLLFNLAVSGTVEDSAARAHLERAASIARAAGAPPDAIAALEMEALGRGGDYTSTDVDATATKALLALESAKRAQTPTAAWLHLVRSNARIDRGNDAGAASDLNAVLSIPADVLPNSGSMQRAATFGLATYHFKVRGNAGDGSRLLARIGRRADICSLLRHGPKAVTAAVSQDDYPLDARQAGLAGSVITERRILPDGSTTDQRVLFEHPPIVFDKATTGALATSRYEPGRMGAKPVACIGGSRTVRWKLPN